MGHYTFTRMGWQQFEHMVQALAQAELGNGLTVFGSGPDGQREATWTGEVSFPVGRELWNGPGVLQAKYLERPKDDRESHWFLTEVRKELAGWLEKRQKGAILQTPEYYIFASNASLSGVSTRGGKDAFDQLIETYRTSLGIKDAVAWDYNQIRTFLDRHPNIRRTYLEMILPGDFLAHMIERLPLPVALTAERMAESAALDVSRRLYTKIGESGYGENTKLKLSDIGIDLPAKVTRTSSIELAQGEERIGRYIIQQADKVHLPSPNGLGVGGTLIVGGPGQGKSTIAQLIAHCYRTTFLREAGAGSFGETADGAALEMTERLRAAGFPTPERRRWPIVVDLPLFSRLSAEIDTPNLLAFIGDQIIVDGESTRPKDLLEWFGNWPVILLLDGFDEVAHARDRQRVIDALHALVIQAKRRTIDLFIVATTRPQGYNGELDNAVRLIQLRLQELREADAMSFADALMLTRVPHDIEERKRVRNRLVQAVREKVSSKLMTTPLQVTIMTALAERAVPLPNTRHELFEQFYNVTYDRERAKNEIEKTLTVYRAHIDYLHERAGLELSIESERVRGADATLHYGEIEAILSWRLKDVGFDRYRAEQVNRDILRATTDRLVLLVKPTIDDSFGFEIRSIQEYMAARAIVDCDDNTIQLALTAILYSAHWRNTYLLAIGRLMKEKPRLARRIVSSLAQFDDTDDEARVLLMGAQVAADLYIDGVGAEYPEVRRDLLRCAVSLLSDPSDRPSRIMHMIVELLADSSLDDGEREIIESALRGRAASEPSSIAAYYLLTNFHPLEFAMKLGKPLFEQGYRYIQPSRRMDHYRTLLVGEILEQSLKFKQSERHAGVEDIIAVPHNWTDVLEKGVFTDFIGERELRSELASVARATRARNPDLSFHIASILRNSASKQIVGGQLSALLSSYGPSLSPRA